MSIVRRLLEIMSAIKPLDFVVRDGPRLDEAPENRFTERALTTTGVNITCPGCGVAEGCNVKICIDKPLPLLTEPALMVMVSCRYCRAEIHGAYSPDPVTLETILAILTLLNDWLPALSKAVSAHDLEQHKEKGGLLS